MKTRNICIWMVLTFAVYCGCSDMNSLHDEYLQRGEKTYMGHPDSVKIFSGQNRVIIAYRNYDPKVGKLTVYWDFRQSSATFDVPTDRLGEELEVTINDLEEKTYTFELVTSNREGKFSSIPMNVSAMVYGPKFAASIANRSISAATIFPFADNRITISWISPLESMIGVELTYRNSSDVETFLKIPNNERNTRITDGKDDAIIRYRTLHSPENCLDTFYTAYASINLAIIEDEKLDRFLFARWNPAGIPYQALSGSGWDIENMWDGNLGDMNNGFSSSSGISLPWSFTFDLGQMARIKRIKIYPRLTSAQEYVMSHPKKIQIYGSPTPDVTTDFSTWVYLGEFNSIKPSGLPAGQVSPEDTEYARGGEQFDATDNTDVAVRYMRFHVEETWVMPTSIVQLMELELFGMIVEDE